MYTVSPCIFNVSRVFQRLSGYCKEALGQLGDKNIYMKNFKSNPMHRVTSLIDGKLQKLVRERKISEENREYLKGKSLNLGRFYLLPKINKRLIGVPARPVISNCGTPTAQCEKAKAKDREALLVQNKENKVNLDVVPLVLDFYLAFSKVTGIVESLWPMLHIPFILI